MTQSTNPQTDTMTEPGKEMSIHDEAMIRIAEQFERFNDIMEKIVEGAGLILESQMNKAGG